MRPYSQRQPFGARDMLIQGDSVRQIWGIGDPTGEQEHKPIRRDPPLRAVPAARSEDVLNHRLGEELQYVRRMLGSLGNQLSGDPILIRRHAVALQSLDIVSQILDYIGNVISSSDPQAAVDQIGMGDLKARLMRQPAL